jgi:CRISPR/Cas system-associated exonuclease Cas4 (RecB family)
MIYNQYKDNLLSKDYGYNGLINRQLCDKIDKNVVKFNDFDKYIIVGFNALTKAEQKIFLELKKEGKAEFYWDYDNYYVENKINEAGLFIRRNLKIFNDDLKIDRNVLLKNKNVTLIAFPLQIAQSKAIPTLLKQLGIDSKDKQLLSKTAIIMPDESNLLPLLHSIPTEIKPVNVTVGYPLKATTTANFITNWFKLLLNLLTNQKIFVSDLQPVLENTMFAKTEPLKTAEFHSKIIEKKANSFDIKFLWKISEESHFLSKLFSPENLTSSQTIIDNLLHILENIFNAVSKDVHKVEIEALYQFYNQVLNLQALFKKELKLDKEFITPKILLRFMNELVGQIHIPFTGKSVEGLQVTTIMETRNLDYENMIVLNLNEDIFPKKASQNSLISQFIRKSFDMPIAAYQDSIFAYFFYRLFHNSKNIILTYSNLISEKSGEMSRFLRQLLLETDIINHQLTYTEQISPKLPNKIEVAKNEEIQRVLMDYVNDRNRYLSASSLTTYLTCPLQFYFQYIARIPETEELFPTYEIDNRQFGSILHNTLEKLYKPYIDKVITQADFENISKQIDAILAEEISNELNAETDEKKLTGFNIIIEKVIRKFIENTLEYDKSIAPFTIASIERSELYGKEYEIDISGTKQTIKIKGIFDRLDNKDGVFRIVDYKTGNVELSINNLEKIFSKIDSRTKAFFQMLLYTLIYKHNQPNIHIEPHVYQIKKFAKDKKSALEYNKNNVNSDNSTLLAEFEQRLIETITEIFDFEEPFRQTENTHNCTYCQFVGICDVKS